MAEEPGPPDPEGSAVFVNWVDQEADDWEAVWQHGPSHRSVRGRRAAVVAWARAQQAERHWVFNGVEFVPLPDNE